MKNPVTYSLLDAENNSDTFYKSLESYTNMVLAEANRKLKFVIDQFYAYINSENIEIPRTKDEYLLELITIGILFNNYAGKASNLITISEPILTYLYKTRNKFPKYKHQIDKVRGILAYQLLERKSNNKITDYNIQKFRHLLKWLNATGEFSEEVIRLYLWENYLSSLTKSHVSFIIKLTVDFSEYFTKTGQSVLGGYIQNVNAFRRKAEKTYKNKENYFFVSRSENEYYLNMFGAEVMNRQLKNQYQKTLYKAILLPTCMRYNSENNCKARWNGNERVCIFCNNNCNIGIIAKEFEKENIPVYLIPHSSNFSKFLIKWANQDKTGLIGVACVLNLLTGGYEMKRLNIASQCVFLDYCSCKNHWGINGACTSLNVNQLKKALLLTSKEEQIYIES